MIEEKIRKTEQRIGKDKHKNNDENERLKDKLRDLDDQSRSDNLRFHGVREYENEPWNDTGEVLKDFLFENLETSKQNLHIETDKKKTILQEQLQQNSVAIKPKK